MSKKYFIEEVKCGVAEGGMACGPVSGPVVTSLKFTVDDLTKWITNSEVEGIPNFFLTEADIYDRLIEDDFDDELSNLLDESAISNFDGIELGEYDDIEDSITNNEDNPAAILIDYIVKVTRCSMEELDEYINAGTKKYVEEIEMPDFEGLDFKSMDIETAYKYRLYLESNLRQPFVYTDMDGHETAVMQKDLKKSLKYTENYDSWRDEYIKGQLEANKGVKFITVPYMFAGVGSYDETMKEEELESFKCFIDGNGSAFMSEPREATQKEIEAYFGKRVLNNRA